jgi:UDP-N-acetylmuramate: L-alanyl-gamma-D-glutamyl-meso-diaminopimelate ligase
LHGKHVLAVAGTHGKTTTTTMLAWILEQAGLNPGFLIGGVPLGFSQSARLGGGLKEGKDYFVVEADEYDSAFFDKRSKFVHYHPRTVILNNLEFDHADIFDDLAAIQKQFHHLVRTIPNSGKIILPEGVAALDEVLAMGCWTPISKTSIQADLNGSSAAEWQAVLKSADGSEFAVHYQGKEVGIVAWSMTGLHSVANGIAAIAAAHHIDIEPAAACLALSNFGGVKRRMELLGTVRGVDVYDDFAHHPTAIETTLHGIRKKIGGRRLWAIIEPRSNTMRMGNFKAQLAESARVADQVIWYQPAGLDWDLQPVVAAATNSAQVANDLDTIINRIKTEATDGDVVVIMSNGGFGGLHGKVLTALQ